VSFIYAPARKQMRSAMRVRTWVEYRGFFL